MTELNRSYGIVIEIAVLVVLTLTDCIPLTAQAQQRTDSTDAEPTLYAVLFRTGPNWVASRQPHEQAYFKEHSANLHRLRQQGSLVVGARFSDVGFIVLSTFSEQEAHALIEQDPAVEHGVFVYELHELSVFYGGTLKPRKTRGRREE